MPDDSAYTLLLAGRRSAKSSFARLLLDTSRIASTSASPAAARDTAANVAKFIHGCSTPTTHIRGVTVAIEHEHGPGAGEPVQLNLLDTPALDFADEHALEVGVDGMVHIAEARFMEAVDDQLKPQGDRHIHLCIYFIDPDVVVPEAPQPQPRARSRGDSISSRDSHNHLDPATAHLYPPRLPPADIAVIRRLSTRINVLPVIARSDTLTNDRLAAVKTAVRRDLAGAGIGFGIFDDERVLTVQVPVDAHAAPRNGHGFINGDGSRGPSSRAASPSTTPLTPAGPRLPYALISPEIYSHSDGVSRQNALPHELMERYTPQPQPPTHLHPHHLPPPQKYASPSPLVRGTFVRNFRWGAVDVLDAAQSDFLHLRAAIFHHMHTLKAYTRQYLLERFMTETGKMLPPRPPNLQSQAQPQVPAQAQHAHPAQGGGLYPPPSGVHGAQPYYPPSSAYDARHQHAHAAHFPLNHSHDQRSPVALHAGVGAAGGHLPPIDRVLAEQADEEASLQNRFSSGSGSSHAHGHAQLPGAGALAHAPALAQPVAELEDAAYVEGVGVKRLKDMADVTVSRGVGRGRSKKIGIACNFCRSRKLKCDGDRPACGQCIKRSNPCDYSTHTKRRARVSNASTTVGGTNGNGTTNGTRNRNGSSAGPSAAASHLHPNQARGGQSRVLGQGSGSDFDGDESISPSASVSASASGSPQALRGRNRAAVDMDVDYEEDEYEYRSRHRQTQAQGQGRGPVGQQQGEPTPHHPDRRAQSYPTTHSHSFREAEGADADGRYLHPQAHGEHAGRGRSASDQGPAPPSAYRQPHPHSPSYTTNSNSNNGLGHGHGHADRQQAASPVSRYTGGPPRGPSPPPSPFPPFRRPPQSSTSAQQHAHDANVNANGNAGDAALPTPTRSPEQPPKRKRGLGGKAGAGAAAAVVAAGGSGGGGGGGSSSASGSANGSAGGAGNGRGGGNYGPKIIACNFCRARKTKCDGIHPTCQSCARRNLPCNYVSDPFERRTSNAAKARAAKAAVAARAALAAKAEEADGDEEPDGDGDGDGQVGIATLNEGPAHEHDEDGDGEGEGEGEGEGGEDEVDQLQSPAISHLALEGAPPPPPPPPPPPASVSDAEAEAEAEPDADAARPGGSDEDADGEVDGPEELNGGDADGAVDMDVDVDVDVDADARAVSGKRQRLEDGSAGPSPVFAGADE